MRAWRAGPLLLAAASSVACLDAPPSATVEADEDGGTIGDDGAGQLDAADGSVDPTLVAHWPLDGLRDPDSVEDVAGGHHASCLECPAFGDGVVDSAATFSGIHGLEVDDVPALQLTTATVSFWVERISTDQYDALIGKAYGAENENSWELYLSDTGAVVFQTYTSAGRWARIGPVIPADTWTHVAAVWNGTDRVLYIGGEKIIEASAPGAPLYDNHPTLIGVGSDSAALVNWYQGALDDIRIHDRVLSQAEIDLLAAR